MTPLHTELDQVGLRLNRWRAEVRALLWVAVILTFTSGAIYLWRNRRLYLADL